jgi:hypothetical protein
VRAGGTFDDMSNDLDVTLSVVENRAVSSVNDR